VGVSLRWLLTGEGDDIQPPVEGASVPHPALGSALAELRSLRAELLAMGERMGRLEKTLKMSLTKEVAGE
ncbi:MAG: transcriptional regulator, partial [Pararhodobacter sp.]